MEGVSKQVASMELAESRKIEAAISSIPLRFIEATYLAVNPLILRQAQEERIYSYKASVRIFTHCKSHRAINNHLNYAKAAKDAIYDTPPFYLPGFINPIEYQY